MLFHPRNIVLRGFQQFHFKVWHTNFTKIHPWVTPVDPNNWFLLWRNHINIGTLEKQERARFPKSSITYHSKDYNRFRSWKAWKTQTFRMVPNSCSADLYLSIKITIGFSLLTSWFKYLSNHNTGLFLFLPDVTSFYCFVTGILSGCFDMLQRFSSDRTRLLWGSWFCEDLWMDRLYLYFWWHLRGIPPLGMILNSVDTFWILMEIVA